MSAKIIIGIKQRMILNKIAILALKSHAGANAKSQGAIRTKAKIAIARQNVYLKFAFLKSTSVDDSSYKTSLITHLNYFSLMMVTPFSPSPYLPRLNSKTFLSVFRYSRIAFIKIPSPTPWITLISSMLFEMYDASLLSIEDRFNYLKMLIKVGVKYEREM